MNRPDKFWNKHVRIGGTLIPVWTLLITGGLILLIIIGSVSQTISFSLTNKPTTTPSAPAISSKNELQTFFENKAQFTFQTAPATSDGNKTVGSTRDGRVHLELVSPDDQLVQANLIFIGNDGSTLARDTNLLVTFVDMTTSDWDKEELNDWLAGAIATSSKLGDKVIKYHDRVKVSVDSFTSHNMIAVSVEWVK